jgi:hypothetical protein
MSARRRRWLTLAAAFLVAGVGSAQRTTDERERSFARQFAQRVARECEEAFDADETALAKLEKSRADTAASWLAEVEVARREWSARRQRLESARRDLAAAESEGLPDRRRLEDSVRYGEEDALEARQRYLRKMAWSLTFLAWQADVQRCIDWRRATRVAVPPDNPPPDDSHPCDTGEGPLSCTGRFPGRQTTNCTAPLVSDAGRVTLYLQADGNAVFRFESDAGPEAHLNFQIEASVDASGTARGQSMIGDTPIAGLEARLRVEPLGGGWAHVTGNGSFWRKNDPVDPDLRYDCRGTFELGGARR